MGFLKQWQEGFNATSPLFLKEFNSVYILPLIIEYGKLNSELLFGLIPTYATYLNNKYIQRN